MKFILIFFFLFSTLAQADAGFILKIKGQKSGYLLREGEKISLKANMILKMGDEIFSQDSFVLIYLNPKLQLSLSKNAVVRLSKLETDLVKGLVRVHIDKLNDEKNDHKIQTQDVIVVASSAEFDFMIAESNDVELDVFSGQTDVSSPHVHSFVPEYVKSQEGLTFQHGKKSFHRRKVQSRLKNHLEFEDFKKIIGSKKTSKK